MLTNSEISLNVMSKWNFCRKNQENNFFKNSEEVANISRNWDHCGFLGPVRWVFYLISKKLVK